MSNNRQCQLLANRFRKFIKGEPKKFSYQVVLEGNKVVLDEGNNKISDVSLRLSDFDQSLTARRKSLRKCKSVNDYLKIEKRNLSKSDSDGIEERLNQMNNFNRRFPLRKSKSLKPATQLNVFIPNKISVPFKQNKALYNISTPAPSSSSPEDENELKFIRGIFPGTGIYNLTAHVKSQDPSRTSSRKRAFFRNFRRTSVRYSSRRKKRKLKATKSSVNNPIKLSTPLRKSYTSDLDDVDGFSPVGEKGKLFGRLLEDICDKDELPPKSIFILLEDLTRRGPSEFGVFRKSGNARIVRELKASLDREEELILTSSTPVTIVASLFKDFIRSLPNCLFRSELYDQWMELCSISNKEKKVQTAQHLCSLIPGSHRILVKLLLYVLNLIAAKSEFNKMTPDNLGICLGPSILNTGKEDVRYDPKVSEVLSFMITNFDEVFGENDKMKIESLLLGEISKETQEDEEGEYSEQFLSETTKHSGVSSSIDSGICSGAEDNYYSDVPYCNHSTPVSIPVRESKASTDEVDARLSNVGFKRNNWMRKGVMKKRNLFKDVRTTVEIVSVL